MHTEGSYRLVEDRLHVSVGHASSYNLLHKSRSILYRISHSKNSLVSSILKTNSKFPVVVGICTCALRGKEVLKHLGTKTDMYTFTDNHVALCLLGIF